MSLRGASSEADSVVLIVAVVVAMVPLMFVIVAIFGVQFAGLDRTLKPLGRRITQRRLLIIISFPVNSKSGL